MSTAAYDAAWFAGRRAGARRSAEIVLPLVLELVAPRRIVDLGCGTGSWLAVARELGVEDVLGVDGDYIQQSAFEIPADRFRAHDLREPLDLGQHFDLALSTEVGEHLREEDSDTFMDSLVRVAPVILFSAAVPFQGGTRHLNEQWQDWWAERFRARGFTAVDCVRPRIWSDPRVKYFYAQNMLLYVREDVLTEHPALARAAGETSFPLRVVHPTLYMHTVRRFPPRGHVESRRLVYFAGRVLTGPLGRRLRGRGR
jgi:SAM-dependent methyltransferase